MGLISEPVRRFLEILKLGYVATVSEDGLPNVSPKGTIMGWDSETLVFADIRSPDTMRNLECNPFVEISVIDPLVRKGFLFRGRSRIVRGGDLYDEAVSWYRKAYDNAKGRYTRFRWGSIYLRQVMELTPEDVDRVEKDSVAILNELLTLDDAFALGNFMRLEQLDSAYQEWNETGEHDELIGRIRDLVHAECDRYPAGDEDAQQSRCTSFLVPQPEEDAAG